MVKKLGQRLWLFCVFVFLYAPILVLIVYSFTSSTMIGAIRGFSLEHYVTLFTTKELLHMIGGTLLLAVTVAFLSTLLGTIGAIGSFYAGKKSGQCINFLNQIPIANAEVVTGFSICVLMIVLFGVDKDTYLPLLVGQTVLCAPFAYLPLLVGQTVLCAPFAYLSVLPKLKQMDPNLYEAALDLGCNHRQALWRVIVREIMPGITSGFMLSVTLSLDDYFITTYTKPAVFDTISTYVVNATKGARTEIKTALWALSAVIFLVVVLVVIGMNMKAGRKQKR